MKVGRDGPLTGLRILDLADERAGLCTRMLSDLGAEVIKVEAPGGERGRAAHGRQVGQDEAQESAWFRYSNSGKAAITLDLDSEDGRAALIDLLRGSDALVENGDAEASQRLGLGPPQLNAINPALVAVSISGFGRTGPQCDDSSSDLVALACGGLLQVNGFPDGPPLRPPARAADHAASLYGAVGVLLGLARRRLDGRGGAIDLSAQEVAASMLEHVLVRALYDGEVARRQGDLSWNGLAFLLPCRDGSIHVSIAAQWETLVEWLAGEGMAEDLTDPKWRDAALRAREVGHIRAVLGRWSITHDADELYQTAQALRMPWAPVHTLRQVLDCPHLRARGFFGDRADASSASFPGLPFRLAGSCPPARQVPRIGQDNDRLRSTHPAREAAPARLASSANAARLKPLAGLRVLDFSWVLAGPYATRILADFGADVIKVQSLRSARDLDANHAAYFDMWNRNKRSLALDMSQPQARGVALDLARACDVVVQNFSPRVMENWGLGYPALKALNPDLILLSLSAMGQTGPWRDHVAFGPALQALAGITLRTGDPQQPAVGLGTAHADHLMGLYGVLAVLAALEGRAAGGTGQHLDVSGYEAACGLVGAELLQAASSIPPDSLVPGAAPEGCYPCRGDDRWCALSVADEGQWRALCGVAGQPQWLHNPAWREAAGRAADALALDAAIAGWTARHDAGELARTLQAAGVAASAVLDARGLLDDPQLRARGFFKPVIHPRRGPLLADRSPIRFADEVTWSWRAAPELGADSREVLREVLGYSDAHIERLSRDGVLR